MERSQVPLTSTQGHLIPGPYGDRGTGENKERL